MKLTEYFKKRDFKKTAEPRGKVKKNERELHFVVQKHDASHLHYDFRLEIEGVMASWAVPKGPSYDPSVRRLAVQVEDHPKSYMNFEGTIPKGQYGGGTVMVWDTGTFLAEGHNTAAESNKALKKQLREGSIKVVLKGHKLKGSWHLVRLKDKNKEWLLIKGKDHYANPETVFNEDSVLTKRSMEQIEKGDRKNPAKDDKQKQEPETDDEDEPSESLSFSEEDVRSASRISSFPAEWRLQLATLTDAVFDNKDWLFENKYDGYRALVQIHKEKVNLISRNGISFNHNYPEIVNQFSNVQDNLVLDGEIVVEDKKGKSRFQWLQDYDIESEGTLKCYLFDILYFNGFDLRSVPLIKRKEILKVLIPWSDQLIYSEHIVGKGKNALKNARKKDLEGIIAKRADSPYSTGIRSKDWLKIKLTKEQEMVIGGYTEPKGSRSGFGALLLGYYENGKLMYAGKVGTGFNEQRITDTLKLLRKNTRKTSPFANETNERNVHWVNPKLVAQVKYSEWTAGKSLRHPVFLALRNDKKPTDVLKETVMKKGIGPEQKATKKKAEVSQVTITHPEKVFWPKEGITKGDVADYYREMADYILPFLVDRPQSLRRTPDGIKSEGFFQKNVKGMVPDWIKTKSIRSASTQQNIDYLVCNDKDTLLFMVNWGCIEMNPWSSRIGKINNPDYIIFDLDPNGAPFKNTVTAAKAIKKLLDNLGIKPYLKTTGGKGLHIFIPVKPTVTYEQTRSFSEIISKTVHESLPNITSVERSPSKRKGMVYLDFLQNGKGKTMASVYSLRPREGAAISTPLEWDELNDKLDVSAFNFKTIAKRMKEKGDLWSDFFDQAIDLKKYLDELQ